MNWLQTLMSKLGGTSSENAALPDRFQLYMVSERHRAAMELAHDLHGFFDKKAEKLGWDGNDVEIQCRAQCPSCQSCCSRTVTVTATETFLIAGFVKALEQEKKARLEADIAEAAARQAKARTAKERAALRVTCPFLSADRGCEVYAVRPLSCRAYASYDEKACAKDAASLERLDKIPGSPTRTRLGGRLIPQLKEREKKQGLAAADYEMIQALYLLAADDAIEAAAAGKDVLGKAKVRG